MIQKNLKAAIPTYFKHNSGETANSRPFQYYTATIEAAG
jgi:hypothetical protein